MKLMLLLIAAVAAFAQPVPTDHYSASASSTALTLQMPATGARQITFGNGPGTTGAAVYCAGAQSATFSWNGGASTATAGTEIKLPGTQQPSGATIWTATNQSGAGTIGPVYNIPAGATMAFDLSWFRFGTGGTSSNLTITTTGTCTIAFFYNAV